MVKQTMVHLHEQQIVQADAEAQRRGVSRSALIRAALDSYLAGGRTSRLDRQMQEGYARIPQATADEWGDLAALADGATRAAMRRLAAEEEKEGGEAW